MIDPLTAKPREIEAYLREVIREVFGDTVENLSKVISSHGFYSVSIVAGSELYDFTNFRRAKVKQIAKAIRLLKA